MSRSRATTIGNFDGVHLGHRALLRHAREAVGAEGTVTAIAFDPHPITVLRPGQAPSRLTTWGERQRLLEQAGADEVVRLQPTPDLLSQEPAAFLEQLVAEHRPDVLVEGDDFRFGRGRSGGAAELRKAGDRYGFELIIVPALESVLTDQSVVRVSSTLVRWLLEHGRVGDASILLGRPHAMVGAVIQGDQRGRDLGFPTANLHTSDQLLPADGIYAGWVTREGDDPMPAAISVGTKPTFGEHARTCEAHMIEHDGPLNDYGWIARFEFTHWLRSQVTYTSLADLIAQIHRDINRARRVLHPSMAATA